MDAECRFHTGSCEAFSLFYLTLACPFRFVSDKLIISSKCSSYF
jgi:hypothetical protein